MLVRELDIVKWFEMFISNAADATDDTEASFTPLGIYYWSTISDL